MDGSNNKTVAAMAGTGETKMVENARTNLLGPPTYDPDYISKQADDPRDKNYSGEETNELFASNQVDIQSTTPYDPDHMNTKIAELYVPQGTRTSGAESHNYGYIKTRYYNRRDHAKAAVRAAISRNAATDGAEDEIASDAADEEPQRKKRRTELSLVGVTGAQSERKNSMVVSDAEDYQSSAPSPVNHSKLPNCPFSANDWLSALPSTAL